MKKSIFTIIICAILFSTIPEIGLSQLKSGSSNVVANTQSILEESKELESRIKSSVEYQIKNYYKVSLSGLRVNADISSRDEEARIIKVNMRFDADNGISLTRELLECYSNEIAGIVAKKYEDKHITKINLFWEAPHIIDIGNAAKYQYEIHDGWLILTSKLGPIYGVN